MKVEIFLALVVFCLSLEIIYYREDMMSISDTVFNCSILPAYHLLRDGYLGKCELSLDEPRRFEFHPSAVAS